MSELKKHRKVDLMVLAEELGVELGTSDRISDIIAKITAADDYDEELVLGQIKNIKEDREKEKEREEKEKEREERERERLHEIAKLQISQSSDNISLGSTCDENRCGVSLKSLIRPFDSEKSEISLFLALFEKHAKKAKIDQSDWVMQLLALMPMHLAEGIMRLKEDQMEDYETVKGYLLDRFRVNAETYRTRFMQASKGNTGLWKDLVFEVRTYLKGWLSELKIDTFDKLQDLMIADQLKKRAHPEMKEKFIDSWSQLVDPESIASKFDEYESVRKTFKKPFHKNNGEERRIDRDSKEGKTKERELSDKKPVNWRDRPGNESRERDKVFEKRKPLTCYNCGSPSHLRPSCPLLKKDRVHPINHISINKGFGSSFEPYLSTARVNGHEFTILRDSGSGIDVIPRKLITSSHLNGEFLWVKQPLENEVRCLPVANVSLNIPNVGSIETKAAVVDQSVEMDFYILGNETNSLIERERFKPNLINAVMTRSQTRNAKSGGAGRMRRGTQNRRHQNEKKQRVILLSQR